MNKDSWNVKPFEKCIKKIIYTNKIKRENYLSNGKYPIISQDDSLISGYWEKEQDVFYVDTPLVIFGDHTRILKYIDFNFVLGADGVKILLPKDDLIAKFFYYYLVWYNIPNLGYSRHYKLLKEIEVLIPPISIQEQIVKELDTLSDIITKKKEQLAELDKLAQATFYDMFGDPVENEIKWERKKLGDLCNIVRGGSPRPISNYLGGNIPWIKIGDASKGNNIYLHSTREHIISDGVKKSRLIPAGSLIFANCGDSLGFARIITFDGCIHDGWLAFNKISETLNEIFLLKLINVQTDYLRASAPDGTQPNLNTTIMKNFPIILPPISLQNQFAEKIEAIEQQKALINQSITDTQLLFDYTMDKYFN